MYFALGPCQIQFLSVERTVFVKLLNFFKTLFLAFLLSLSFEMCTAINQRLLSMSAILHYLHKLLQCSVDITTAPAFRACTLSFDNFELVCL